MIITPRILLLQLLIPLIMMIIITKTILIGLLVLFKPPNTTVSVILLLLIHLRGNSVSVPSLFDKYLLSPQAVVTTDPGWEPPAPSPLRRAIEPSLDCRQLQTKYCYTSATRWIVVGWWSVLISFGINCPQTWSFRHDTRRSRDKTWVICHVTW